MTDGPHLWVAKLLHHRGSLSSKKIWEEYQKDHTLADPEMIRSKTYLKTKILYDMHLLGKLQKAPAQDMKGTKRAGWKVVP